MVRASGFAIHIAVCPLSNARVLAGRTLWRWRKVVVPGNDSVERDSSGLLPRPVGRPSHKPVVGYDRRGSAERDQGRQAAGRMTRPICRRFRSDGMRERGGEMQVFGQEVLLGLLAVAILVFLVLYERKHVSRKTERARRVNRALDLWMSIAQGERGGPAFGEKRGSQGTQVQVWEPR